MQKDSELHLTGDARPALWTQMSIQRLPNPRMNEHGSAAIHGAPPSAHCLNQSQRRRVQRTAGNINSLVDHEANPFCTFSNRSSEKSTAAMSDMVLRQNYPNLRALQALLNETSVECLIEEQALRHKQEKKDYLMRLLAAVHQDSDVLAQPTATQPPSLGGVLEAPMKPATMIRDLAGDAAVGVQVPYGDPKDQNVREAVKVPTSEHVAEIVGRQGCKIKALRSKTNTYIQTPQRGAAPIFVITGRSEDVTKAREQINAAADHFTRLRANRRMNKESTDLSSSATLNIATFEFGKPESDMCLPSDEAIVKELAAAGKIRDRLLVDFKMVGLVVGAKGANVKKIQNDTNTYIVTPSRECAPEFEITGKPEGVAAAKKMIMNHIAERMKKAAPTTGSVTNVGGEFGATLSPMLNYPSSFAQFPACQPTFANGYDEFFQQREEPNSFRKNAVPANDYGLSQTGSITPSQLACLPPKRMSLCQTAYSTSDFSSGYERTDSAYAAFIAESLASSSGEYSCADQLSLGGRSLGRPTAMFRNPSPTVVPAEPIGTHGLYRAGTPGYLAWGSSENGVWQNEKPVTAGLEKAIGAERRLRAGQLAVTKKCYDSMTGQYAGEHTLAERVVNNELPSSRVMQSMVETIKESSYSQGLPDLGAIYVNQPVEKSGLSTSSDGHCSIVSLPAVLHSDRLRERFPSSLSSDGLSLPDTAVFSVPTSSGITLDMPRFSDSQSESEAAFVDTSNPSSVGTSPGSISCI